jgi:hypothetical protein
MRGRIQVFWEFNQQVRADAARTWLNGQLSGRSYIEENLPPVTLMRGRWRMVADVSFDTLAEARVIQTLADARQSADSFILPGGYFTYHVCEHDEGINRCKQWLEKTVK